MASRADPAVTVVIPTYCRPHLLGRLVAALEQQTLPTDAFDVVIVDNASPDDTAIRLRELVASTTLRLQGITEERRGPAAARNAGWRRSQSPVIAFIDDDCVPEPGWLEAGVDAMSADSRLGVVQGCTRTPADAPIGNWTLTREIAGPTPYFEGLNIFYRRAALEGTGGFDEDIANYGEDASLGWAVVDAGWGRGYAAASVVYHDAEERGVRYHLWAGLLERNVALLAKRYPQFRQDAFWRPWAFRPKDAKFTLALVSAIVALWRPAALVGSVPYAHHLFTRRPSSSGLIGQGRWVLERIAVDAAQFVGMRVGSIRHRVGVL